MDKQTQEFLARLGDTDYHYMSPEVREVIRERQSRESSGEVQNWVDREYRRIG